VKSHIAVVAVLIAALGMPGRAQEQKPAAPPTLPSSMMKVQLVLSRYQSEKKVSSLPYTLTMITDERNRNTGRANLRLGTQVPLTTMSRQSGDANAPLVPTVQYRDTGTSIDCIVTALEDGRFKLDLTIEDSSIDTAAASGANGAHPAFKSFRTIDTLLLRDGQSAQYSTATDKVNAEVWKVDVTLNVVK
jgi:hypothetical protein